MMNGKSILSKEIIIEIKGDTKKVKSILILILLCIFSSCDSDPVPSDDKSKYMFLEIQRCTRGKSLSRVAASVDIDFGAYQFNPNTGALKVFYPFRGMDSSRNWNFLFAFDRSLEPDIGTGHAGFVSSIDNFPCILPIMACPLPFKDTIIINKYWENGEIDFEYDGKRVELKLNSEWKYLREYDLTFNYGSYEIKDEIIIKNHGLFRKENVKF